MRTTTKLTLAHSTGDVVITIETGSPRVNEYLEKRMREIFTAPKPARDKLKDRVDQMMDHARDEWVSEFEKMFGKGMFG